MPTFIVHISYRDKHSGLFDKLTHTTTQASPNDARKVALALVKENAILGSVECRKIKLLREHGSK